MSGYRICRKKGALWNGDGRIQKGESFFLCSDGMMEHLSLNKNGKSSEISFAYISEDPRLLEKRMDTLTWKDDASYAVMTC